MISLHHVMPSIILRFQLNKLFVIVLLFLSFVVYSQSQDFIYGIRPNERIILVGEIVEIISRTEFVLSDESGFCLVDTGITPIVDLNLEEGDEIEIFAQSDRLWNLESKRTIYALEITKDHEIYPVRQVRFSSDY